MDKYELILKELKERIESGELGEGARIPTEAELCALHGVSRITAMRAVKELQAAGLVRRVSGRGTFVCRKALRSTCPFHLLAPSCRNAYYSAMLEAFCGFFRAKGAPALVSLYDYQTDCAKAVLNALSSSGSRGLAVVPSSDLKACSELPLLLKSLSFPVVVGSRALPGFNGPQTIVDEELAGFLAASYLLEQGRRDVLYVGPSETSGSASASRLQGVRRALVSSDGSLALLERVDSASLPRLREIFSGERPPSAVIAADDFLAAGVYDLLKALDLVSRAALIGLDGGLLGLSLEIPLTSVEFPGAAVGEGLAASLWEMDSNPGASPKPEIVKLPPRLVKRASCGESPRLYRHEYLRDVLRGE